MKVKNLLFILLFAPMLSWATAGSQDDNSFIPYYRTQGSISLHLSNYMFSKRKVAMPPLNFSTQFTVVKNLTAGPMLTYFQFRRSEFEAANATRWINSEIRYNEMMGGVKVEYHFYSLVKKIFNRRNIRGNRIDLYTSGWAGYSFVWANDKDADQTLIDDNKTFRGGIGLGARTLVLKWMGFSLEGGYSSYGYASFGLVFVVR